MHDRLCTWPNLETARAAAILFGFSGRAVLPEQCRWGDMGGADFADIYECQIRMWRDDIRALSISEAASVYL